MRDAKVFLKLLQLELTAHPPGAPVTKVWIAAEPAPPRSAQRGLFLPISPEAERLELRWRESVGLWANGGPASPACWIAIGEIAFVWSVCGRRIETASTPHCQIVEQLLALRMFRPAWQLRCVLEGRPVKLRVARSSGVAGKGSVVGRAVVLVRRLVGAEGEAQMTVTGLSSAKNGMSRLPMEGRVALYRIYRDLASGHWFADASYD